MDTELGSIPSDWVSCRFEDVMDGFSSGQTPYREIKRYYSGDIPWITSGELNYNIIINTLEKITPEAVQKTSLKIIPKGTFLMAITGLEAEGTRGSCAITGVDATTNQSCMALYPKAGLLTTEYLFHFYVRYGSFLAFKYCQGTKQQSYTGAIARTLPIILPPTIEEQAAIAAALSDADALITSLEKLIAKKRLVKQGVLQDLLTPKNDWSKIIVGDIGNPYGGLTGKSKNDFGDGNAIYIPFMNIMSNPIIDLKNLEQVRIKPGEYQNRVRKGDLLFNGSSETPEEVGMCSVLMEEFENLYLNSFCFGFRLNSERQLNGLFLSYFFRSSFGRDIFFSLAQGATRYNLSKSNFLKLEIDLPSVTEQNRIATTINDIDNEIAVLEKKLAKQRLLKQGMMQNLLTGKIRLA
ncbi:MAG TPA: restriction endonuclease subunit S [Cyclobacteriaceae bacterium]|nr:restriction endonuclease subunit S [Cyclobacteriaceae bacterium]HMV08166.1 restriction endonuclease subunit S [Cyclobacteriaceae bacterium]HMX00807.1 restriction endonuclease subunit S [Cyclobacteriaceae bacterium]HMX49318.1 restriction endonuclease subunit S [Cyclobacteriaceae bacterium]HMY93610.1 restriction endonuclease subunit S [Cyclobacteriaceae bacterium]